MRRRKPGLILFGFIAVFFFQAMPVAAGDDLAGKIEAVIHGPNYKEAHWGILVVDGQSGETIYAHNPDHLFFPASTTKLYSCSAALAALGADHKFETPVYRRGDFKN